MVMTKCSTKEIKRKLVYDPSVIESKSKSGNTKCKLNLGKIIVRHKLGINILDDDDDF